MRPPLLTRRATFPAPVAADSTSRDQAPARPRARKSAAAPKVAEPTAPAQTPATGRTNGPRSVVLVGVGAARRLYFPALLALQEIQRLAVRAIVSPDYADGAAAREAFPDAVHATSFEKLPALPDALAILATPPRFHVVQANAAFRRGWHVLCASPLARSAADAVAMIAAAQRQERLLAVDLRARFFPAAVFLRALCEDHLLGPPLHFRIELGSSARRASETTGPDAVAHPDGAFTTLGPPALELLTWCFGQATILNYADDAMGGVEANAALDLSFGESVRGRVHVSTDWPVTDHYAFEFERGRVHWDGSRVNALTVQLSGAPAALQSELHAPLKGAEAVPGASLVPTEDAACLEQLENVLAAIAGRETLRVPATEAMHSLPLLEAAYAQRSPLTQPWLSPNDATHARALSPPATLRRP